MKKSFLQIACNPELDEELLSAFDNEQKSTQVWVRENLARLRNNATKEEKRFARILYALDVKFISQTPFIFTKNGTRRIYFADFYIPQYGLIVEIDGVTHHKQEEHDRVRDADFLSIGIRTIRIPNNRVMRVSATVI